VQGRKSSPEASLFIYHDPCKGPPRSRFCEALEQHLDLGWVERETADRPPHWAALEGPERASAFLLVRPPRPLLRALGCRFRPLAHAPTPTAPRDPGGPLSLTVVLFPIRRPSITRLLGRGVEA
jgi:hypothetical protein